MKLKTGFVTYDFDGTQVMVATGGADFNGIVRSNKTAAFIVDMLKEETTQQQIVAAMEAKYDAPADVIAADVDKILTQLREIGALDE